MMRRFFFAFFSFLLVVGLLNNAFSLPAVSPVIEDFRPLAREITGSVILQEPNVVLRLKPPFKDSWLTFEVSQEGVFSIPANATSIPGKYHYYFEGGGKKMPQNGTFILFLYHNNSQYLPTYESFANNNSIYFCQPLNATNQSEYECENELFQAREIERFSSLYYETREQKYLDAVMGLISSDWADVSSSSTCNPHWGQFSCGPRQIIQVYSHSGAKRQAHIIDSLWNAYAFTRDATIMDLAINFSDNHPHECNVWELDFDCGSSSDQGDMIRAFSNAFLHTGNSDYKEIAYNLSIESHSKSSSVGLARGLLFAYEVFGDEYFINQALDRYEEEKDACLESACNIERFYEALLMHHEFYLFSNDYYLNESENIISLEDIAYRRLMLLLNHMDFETCGKTNGTCHQPYQQALGTKLFRELAYNTRTEQPGIYDVRVSSARIDSNITVSAKSVGETGSLKLNFRDSLASEDPFLSVNFSHEGVALIAASHFPSSTFLEFFINSTQGYRFPEEGTSLIPIPFEFLDLSETLAEIAFSNPVEFCEPFSSDPVYGCVHDFMHGDYLHALAFHDKILENPSFSHAVLMVGNATIDITDPRLYSTCDPTLIDYQCELVNPRVPRNPLRLPVYRAALLIKGYLELYENTGDPLYRDYAFSFIYTPQDGCDFMAGNYDCENTKAQGEIISALAKAYQLSGRSDIQHALDGLVSKALFMSYNTTLEMGLLDYLAVFSNQTVRDRILDFLSQSPTCTEDFSCSSYELYRENELYWKAFGFFEEDSLFLEGNNLLRARPISFGYCDPNTGDPLYQETKHSCEYPDEQASLLRSYSAAARNYVNRDPPDLKIDLFAPNKANLHDLVNVICEVTNVDSTSLPYANLVLSSGHLIVSVDTNASKEGNYVQIKNLEPDQKIYANFTLNLTTGGNTSVSCFVLNFGNLTFIEVDNIGDILSLSSNPYVNTFNNNTLYINLTNKKSFPILNVSLNLSYPNISGLDFSPGFHSYSIPMLFAHESYLINLSLEGSYDGHARINISATSDNNGSSEMSVDFLKVINSMQISYETPSELLLFTSKNLTVLVNNTKSYPINLSFNFSFPDSIIESESFFQEHLNQSESSSFSLGMFLQNHSNESIKYNLSIFSPWGINLSESFDAISDNRIIRFDAEDITIQEAFNGTGHFNVSNIGLRNLTNVSLFLNSTNVNLTEYYAQPLMLISRVNQSLINASIPLAITNLSKDDEQGVTLFANNSTETFNFTFSASPNSFNYSLLVKSSLFSSNSTLFVTDHNGKSCFLSPGRSYCNLSHNGVPNLNFSIFFSSEQESNVTIQFLMLQELNISVINLSEEHDGLLLLYNLEPENILTVVFSFVLDSNLGTVDLFALNADNATGSDSFKISRFLPSASGAAGSRGGEGSAPVQEEEYNETWILEEIVHEVMLDIGLLLETILEEKIFNPFNLSKSQVDLNTSLSLSSCISAKRRFIPVNNTYYLVSFHLDYNCDEQSQIVIYEPLSPLLSFSDLETNHPYSVGEKYIAFLINQTGLFKLYSFKLEGQLADLSAYANSNLSTPFGALSLPDLVVDEDLPDESEEEPDFVPVHRTSAVTDLVNEFWKEALIVAFLIIAIFIVSSYIIDKNLLKPLLLFKRYKVSFEEQLKEKISRLQKKKISISSEEKVLVDINMALLYAEALLKKNKQEETLLVFKQMLEILRKNKAMLAKYAQTKFRGKLFNLIQRMKSVAYNLKESGHITHVPDMTISNNDEKKQSLDEIKKEDRIHYDYYIKLLKLQHLLEESRFDEADKLISYLSKKISQIGNENEKYKELLSSLLDKLKKKAEEKKSSSFMYKVKTRVKGLADLLKEKFSQD